METIELKLDEFVEYKGNPRKNDHAVDKMAQSIKEFGFRVPVLIKADKTIIDGHLRLKAARSAGLATIPAVYVDDLTEAQVKAFRIAINRMAELADWDEILLGKELEELRNMDFDLDLTGFDTRTIDDFINSVPDELTEEDAVPPPPDVPISSAGDVWVCGPHRIMCGNWLNAEHRKLLMGDHKVNMIFTDPPYNADYSSRVDKGRRKEWGGIKNDNMSDEAYDTFIHDVFGEVAAYLTPNASIYACIDYKSYPILAHHLGEYFAHKSTIIWDKTNFGLGTYYRTQYEMILFCAAGDKIIWNAAHDEKDVWAIKREVLKDYVHPTQKPVAIPERAILNSSNNSDLVLDMFCGSGSTLIACQKQGRKCFTIDIDPRYVDVAVKRYQDFTGQKAIKEGTGEFYDDIKIKD